MTILHYFLCFAIYSFIGWAYESAFYTIQQRRLVNSGFLTTCFCPIYGIGALLIILILSRIENPVLLFFAGMILCSALEYSVSWLLEKLFHQRWWDYTGWPLNVNGRICVIAAAAFGFMAVLLVKVVEPITTDFVWGLNPTVVYFASFSLMAVMLADLIVNVKYMDKLKEKLWYIEKQAEMFAAKEDGIIRRIRDTFNM